MLFNSYSFIIFFAVVLILHYMRFSWKVKKVNLLAASYLFYACWNPPFILFLWLTTVMDFYIGNKLYVESNRVRRKFLLIVSLIVNLGMLGYFKYGNFILENFVSLLSGMGINYHPAAPSIILPVGISFYTFQSLSYIIDMYRRKEMPEKSLLDFSLYVTFFPHLVAGPLVRKNQLMPQFKTPRQATQVQFLQGLLLLSVGLFMKVVMADAMLSGPADKVFNAKQSLFALDAWLGVLAFSGQIFFDFAGYSTCAIGIAACLGFTLPENFRYPYAAIGFSDFWRRWHISLSTWLRDYLYIPLGGNRLGASRTYINLMITMLLGGLWHGASWTFVVWGALHGAFLCIERLFQSKKSVDDSLAVAQQSLGTSEKRLVVERASIAPAFLENKSAKQFLLTLFTFFLVTLTWVFFRAADFSTAWRLLTAMFGFEKSGMAVLPTLEMIEVVVITVALIATHWFMRNTSVWHVAQKTKWWIVAIVWSLLLVLVILSQKSSDSFIYFQF